MAERTRRFDSLDALRGVAAMSVGLSHQLAVYQGGDAGGARSELVRESSALKYSPTYPLHAGYESVLLFFVLSGFVLCLPWLRGTPPKYGAFLTKRVFRIYVPYLAALFLAVAVRNACHGADDSSLGPWFNHHWHTPLSAHAVRDHVIALGHYETAEINPVLWSLIVEMRISICFPVLGIFISRCNTRTVLAVAVALWIGRVVTSLATTNEFVLDTADTLYFGAAFLVGGTIAKNLTTLRARYAAARTVPRSFAFVGAWLGLAYGRIFSHIIPFGSDPLLLASSSFFVVAALEGTLVKQLLQLRALSFLGQISYSYYLVHAVVLFGVMNTLDGKLPDGALIPLIFVSGILVASIFHYVIEAPAMRLGALASRHLPLASAK